MEVVVRLLDSVLSPLLAPLGPVLALFVTSVTVTLLLTLAYGLLVDQEKMRTIRTEMQKIQKKIKKAQDSGNQKAMERHANESLRLANEQLRMMLRFYVGSMVVIVLVFPWIAHAFGPVTVLLENGNTNTVTVPLSMIYGGNHTMPVPGNESTTLEIDTPSGLWKVQVSEKQEDNKTMLLVKPFEARLPFPLPFVGDTVGWLGFYILASIPVSMFTRKLLGMA